MFKEKVNVRTDGRMHGPTHDRQRAMTKAHWPMASGAKNQHAQSCSSISRLSEHGKMLQLLLVKAVTYIRMDPAHDVSK